MQDVAHRRAGGRRDDADPPRQARQGPLALCGEQSFLAESCAQLLELPFQGAQAGVFHVIDDELVLAARLVQPDAGPHQHLLAVPRGEGAQHISLPEHGAANLSGGVLQRKIPVAGAGFGEIGDFRLQPEAAEAALQQHSDLAIEPRNAVNIALRPGRGGGALGRFHPQMIAVYRTAGARYNAPPLR